MPSSPPTRIPPDWVCPYCKNKKCRAYDRTEQNPGSTRRLGMMGSRRQAMKDQIRELLACKRRMKGKA